MKELKSYEYLSKSSYVEELCVCKKWLHSRRPKSSSHSVPKLFPKKVEEEYDSCQSPKSDSETFAILRSSQLPFEWAPIARHADITHCNQIVLHWFRWNKQCNAFPKSAPLLMRSRLFQTTLTNMEVWAFSLLPLNCLTAAKLLEEIKPKTILDLIGYFKTLLRSKELPVQLAAIALLCHFLFHSSWLSWHLFLISVQVKPMLWRQSWHWDVSTMWWIWFNLQNPKFHWVQLHLCG